MRLTEHIVADKVARPIQLDTANHAYTSEIVTIPAQQGLACSGIIMPSAVRPTAGTAQLSLRIPYTGTRQAFTYRPSTRRSQPPKAVISDREVIIFVTGTDAALAEQQLPGQEQSLLTWVELINADIGRLARQARALVNGRLNERLTTMWHRDELTAALTILARRVEPGRAPERPVQHATTTPRWLRHVDARPSLLAGCRP